MHKNIYQRSEVIVGVAAACITLAAVIAGPYLSAFYQVDDIGTHRSRHKAAEEQRGFVPIGETTWIDGEDIAYYGLQYGFRFDRPYRWQGRSFLASDALQSTGYSPFKLDFNGSLMRTNKPEEELIVIVRATDKTLDTVVSEKAATDGTSTTLGGRSAMRYKTSDGQEVITAIFKGKQYDVILQPATASERLKNAYEKAVESFKFIDRNLRPM
jgi:hypothetical protein